MQTKPKMKDFWFRVRSFYATPVVTYWFNLLFYVMFLLFFCQVRRLRISIHHTSTALYRYLIKNW